MPDVEVDIELPAVERGSAELITLSGGEAAIAITYRHELPKSVLFNSTEPFDAVLFQDNTAIWNGTDRQGGGSLDEIGNKTLLFWKRGSGILEFSTGSPYYNYSTVELGSSETTQAATFEVPHKAAEVVIEGSYPGPACLIDPTGAIAFCTPMSSSLVAPQAGSWRVASVPDPLHDLRIVVRAFP